MKKQLLSLLLMITAGFVLNGQVYLDEFDDGVDGSTFYGSGFSGVEADGEWTITGDGTAGAYTPFGLAIATGPIDITGNNKVFVRAKASKLGTKFRMDAVDADGYVTNASGIVKTLISDYLVIEFDFTDKFMDGGFGGSPCDTGPCPVDGTNIREFQFFIEPDNGAFEGTVVLDFLAVGEEPSVGPMSDVWQDHFDNDNALDFMGSTSPGIVNTIEDSQWKITGDGTNIMWDNVNLFMYNPTTLDSTDVSTGDGDDKVYVRMKSNVEGTVIRIDIQDINDFASTGGSISKTIKVADEWKTYEFNFAGAYQDLGYGGTGCDEISAPCDLNPDRIKNMILFVNPGSEAFAGQVDIEYISIGTRLEAGGDDELILAYGDHFSDNGDFVSTTGAYGLEVNESILKITGTGVDAAYSSIAYSTHDDDTNQGITVNSTGNDKVFIRARSTANNTQLRVDLIDTTGFVTSEPAKSFVLSEEWNTYELEFDVYVDGGYGGPPCDMGPCDVDATVIETVLFYPNPVDGMFEGDIEIDYISFGAPMGEDVFKYSDQFDNGDRTKISDVTGYAIEEADGVMTITGDGSAGMWDAFQYSPHNQDTNEDYVLNLTPNNKLYIKVKATKDVPLRIDLVDADGFVTTEPSTVRQIGSEYQVLEFDFTDTYMDGGYGGTACDTGPCDVDGTRITGFTLFLDPGVGAYDGEVTIDWISTIEPLETITNEGPLGQDNYQDEMTDNSLDFISGVGGLETRAEDGLLKIVGDGSSDMWSPAGYTLHEAADAVMVNALNNEGKVYMRVVTTTPGTTLRVDLIDNMNVHTSNAGLEQELTADYQVLEYDFTGKYEDGGFGGTGCEQGTGPCPVDGERISSLNFYINPGVGAFDGEVHIDWITFGTPITTNVIDHDILSGAKIYPNPANEVLYVEMKALKSGNMTASFVDVAGRVVSNQSLGNIAVGKSSHSVNLEGIAPGMYVMYINIDGQRAFYNKVIVR